MAVTSARDFISREYTDAEPVFGIGCLICGRVEKLYGPHYDGLAICKECRRRIKELIYPQNEEVKE